MCKRFEVTWTNLSSSLVESINEMYVKVISENCALLKILVIWVVLLYCIDRWIELQFLGMLLNTWRNFSRRSMTSTMNWNPTRLALRWRLPPLASTPWHPPHLPSLAASRKSFAQVHCRAQMDSLQGYIFIFGQKILRLSLLQHQLFSSENIFYVTFSVWYCGYKYCYHRRPRNILSHI